MPIRIDKMTCVWCSNGDATIVELTDQGGSNVQIQAMEEGLTGQMPPKAPLEAEAPESEAVVPSEGGKVPGAWSPVVPVAEPLVPVVITPKPSQTEVEMVERPQVPVQGPTSIVPEPSPAPTPAPVHTPAPAGPPPKPPPGGFFKRQWNRFEQQREPVILLPLWLYRRPAQASCSFVCTAIFIIIGALMVGAASSITEVVVPYTHTNSAMFFDVPADISGNVLVWYELPKVYMNQKRFIESKDTKVYPTLMSKVICDSASTLDDARWRREGDPAFLSMLNSTGEGSFLPCGLVALSMFTDEFEFFKYGSGTWQRVAVDETNLAITLDSTALERKIIPATGGGSGGNYTIGGAVTWLRGGSFFEHFKVWYRSPASPHVRNLWATIKGGMTAGKYRVVFTQNSPIWTQDWGVPEKRVILSSSHTLGSSGAVRFVGAVSLAIGCMEALTMAAIMVFSLSKPQPKV